MSHAPVYGTNRKENPSVSNGYRRNDSIIQVNAQDLRLKIQVFFAYTPDDGRAIDDNNNLFR